MNSVVDLLQRGKYFLVISHKGPDGDAVGSTLALGLAIEKAGKKATFFNPDIVPKHLSFLSSVNRIQDKLDGFNGDTVVAVDAADFERLGDQFKKFYEKTKLPLINIDHHSTNTRFGDAYLVEPKFSSTCEVIFDLLNSMKWEITPEIANALLCGIVADTGSFKYRNTTSKVLRTAAILVDAGAHPEQIAQKLFDTYPSTRVFLLRRVLQTFKLDFNNRVASIIVREKDLIETGATVDVSEGFVELLRGIEGVEVAILAKEQKDGNVKISTRSRERVDVSKICLHFGGGGHRAAAGATLPGPVELALSKFLKEVEKLI